MTTKKLKIGISYSGGLDSFILYRYATIHYPDAEVICKYFDIGQDYAAKEIATLPEWVEVRKIEWLRHGEELAGKEGSKSGNIIIPGRNMVLATMMASLTLADEIWMGALLGETHAGSTDKNYDFINYMNTTLSYVYSPFKEGGIEIKFPLADAGMGKFESVEWALNNGLTPDQLMATSSCLNGENGNCGRCVVCCRRWGIFGQLGFEEKYNVHPMEVPQNLDMVLEMIKGERGDECHYDEFRRREIMPFVYAYFDLGNLDKLRAAVNDRMIGLSKKA
jgi:7-cyano-7-deazaguanine synthase in queuosine biosynthesis